MFFWGMHWYWWFFWILLWALFFSFMMPVRRTTYRQMQSPLQLLQRRDDCRGNHNRGIRRTADQTPAGCQYEIEVSLKMFQTAQTVIRGWLGYPT